MDSETTGLRQGVASDPDLVERMPDINSPVSCCHGAGIPEFPVADGMTSTMADDLLVPDQPGTHMHKNHETEESRAVDLGPEPRCTRVRSHTRIAHSTLSIPHARATSCRVSTCRRTRR